MDTQTSGVEAGGSVGAEITQGAAPEAIADVPMDASEVTSETPESGAGEGRKQTPANNKAVDSLDAREDFRAYQAQRDRAEALRIAQIEAQYAAQLQADRAQYRQQFAQSLEGLDPETQVAMLKQEIARRDAYEVQAQAQSQQQAQAQAVLVQNTQAVQRLAAELGVEWGKAKAVLSDINPYAPDAYGLAATRLAKLVSGTLKTQQAQQPKVEKAAAQMALVKAGVMRTSSGAGSSGTGLAALEARAKALETQVRAGSDSAYVEWADVRDQIKKIKSKGS
jgi:hypothetical protein